MIRRANPDDAAAIANVHINSWRSTYCGLMPDSVLDNLDASRRRAGWQRILEDHETQFTFVVTDDKEDVVGFVNGGPERERDAVYTGEIYALYLLETQQKRGYGKALFLALARELLGHGHAAMLVWVLSTNPARRFYEAMDGHHLKTKTIEIGGAALEEAAYGWDDLPSLLARYDSASAYAA